ncbi:sensor histidine kinase [Streptomyces sp. HB2AG]|uniref:sensor histidine kinase n=1 Tax=Streptomyces sp. HB2AG TaxID=2983400 RepID=UPI0022AA2DDF|nr:ATP-binding protein [Streptomyces sp. HB2AG]MCZ2524171.1 ATP-binding protein [Streptomyces sp. HB2AG]
MVRAGSSPGAQRPPSAVVWLLPPLVTAVAAFVAATAVPDGAGAAVAWCGAVATAATAVVAAEAARRGRALAALRHRQAEREAELRRRLDRQETEAVRLADVLLPEALDRLRQGATPERVLEELDDEIGRGSGPAFAAAHRAVLSSVLEAVTAEEDLRESAQRAFVNIARRVQAIVHQQAQDLREMEDRHGRDPDVFGDLLHLDHGTALIGRLADSIAVLGGARPGRQWSQNVPLFSVLRGAMSRIIDYQRVELHSVAEVAVVGPAVEPLIHALAELLDNATRYSPPQTRVHLTATEIQSGVAVEIEDGGVGLTEEAAARAERVLTRAWSGLDITDLGETPRLGLAVVGRLAETNNFQVSLRPSAYAGVRAVLVIPQDQITASAGMPRGHAGALPHAPLPHLAAPGRTHGGRAPAGAVRTAPPRSTALRSAPPAPADPAAAPTGPVRQEPVVTERTEGGLPRRRRRESAPRPRPALGRTAAPGRAVQEAAPSEPAVQPGLWLSAFQSGVSGEPSTTPVHRNGDETLDESE